MEGSETINHPPSSFKSLAFTLSKGIRGLFRSTGSCASIRRWQGLEAREVCLFWWKMYFCLKGQAHVGFGTARHDFGHQYSWHTSSDPKSSPCHLRCSLAWFRSDSQSHRDKSGSLEKDKYRRPLTSSHSSAHISYHIGPRHDQATFDIRNIDNQKLDLIFTLSHLRNVILSYFVKISDQISRSLM